MFNGLELLVQNGGSSHYSQYGASESAPSSWENAHKNGDFLLSLEIWLC